MVEKIKLLNNLNRVELIKLLNIEKMNLEELVDLYIIVESELSNKYKSIKKIELKDEFFNFYNITLDDKYKSNFFGGMMDILNLIDLKNMDFCELLYMSIIIEDIINEKFLKNVENYFLKSNDMLYLNNNMDGFGKISFINFNNVLYGVDKKYNFYIGKVDCDNNCVLFNILRKGIPDDLTNDVLVFNGRVFNNNLDGIWSIGSNDISEGINKINNMYNCIVSDDYNFDANKLFLAYISCSNYTKTLTNLFNKINNDKSVRRI